MRKHQAYCLAPDENGYQAVCLRPAAGEFDFEVTWERFLSLDSGKGDRLWRELVAAEKRVTLLFDGDKALLHQMRLPPLKPRERRNAIQGMMRKQRGQLDRNWYIESVELPPPPGGAQNDPRGLYTVLSTEEEVLNAPLADLRTVGLRPARVAPKPLALEALMRKHHPEFMEAGGAWSLVYLGDRDHFLIIGDATGPLLIRPLPEDLSGGADRDEYLARLTTEVERSNFFARQGEVSTQVARVVLTGKPALADAMMQLLRENDTFELIRWRPEERFAVDGEPADWEHITLLAGAAMRYDAFDLNLLPPRREDTVAWKLRHYTRVGAVAAGLWLLPLLLAGSLMTGNVQNRVADQQTEQLTYSRHEAWNAADSYLSNLALLSRGGFLNELGPRRGNLATFLRDLSARTPGAVRLTGLDVRKHAGGYSVTIDGECTTSSSQEAQDQFLAFQEALRGSPLLMNDDEPVFLEITGDTEIESRSTVSFRLAYNISKELAGS